MFESTIWPTHASRMRINNQTKRSMRKKKTDTGSTSTIIILDISRIFCGHVRGFFLDFPAIEGTMISHSVRKS
ncbi:hypothetical protein RB195_025605 [Necator americanus]|uniref:Uncharacterized protein n=1 Tax=Necator americanus TaxID=51031 RepID=A0ABR1ET27_NECAM